MTTESIEKGSPACAVAGATVELPKKSLLICGFINSHPNCSCKGCTMEIPKERGEIRCCTMKLFSFAECERAHPGAAL